MGKFENWLNGKGEFRKDLHGGMALAFTLIICLSGLMIGKINQVITIEANIFLQIFLILAILILSFLSKRRGYY